MLIENKKKQAIRIFSLGFNQSIKFNKVRKIHGPLKVDTGDPLHPPALPTHYLTCLPSPGRAAGL